MKNCAFFDRYELLKYKKEEIQSSIVEHHNHTTYNGMRVIISSVDEF